MICLKREANEFKLHELDRINSIVQVRTETIASVNTVLYMPQSVIVFAFCV